MMKMEKNYNLESQVFCFFLSWYICGGISMKTNFAGSPKNVVMSPTYHIMENG